jgi:hypothetical protein
MKSPIVMPKMPKAPRLPKAIAGKIPQRAGQVSSVSHVLGFSPRHNKTQFEPGTNPSKPPGELGGFGPKRKAGGLSQHTAPYKHSPEAQGSASGIEGPGEGLPI